MSSKTLPQRRNRMWLRDPDEGGGGGNSLPAGLTLGMHVGSDDGDGGDDGDGDGGQQVQQQTAEEFKPITSQEDLDKILGKRVAQVERRYKHHDDYKAKAEQYDSLAAASQTDQERAVADAERAATLKAVPRIVRAEFKAEARAAGLGTEQLNALLEDLDLTKYATDDGEADEDKIARKVKALAPVQNDPPPDFGQGKRGGNGKTKDMNRVIREAAGRG